MVILGSVGDNFGAGMTGGMAFIYDADETLPIHINDESVIYQRLSSAHWEGVLRREVEIHVQETQSKFAQTLLVDWDRVVGRFWQICPKEMVSRLAHPLSDQPEARRA